MTARIQVVLSERERDRFRVQAKREGLSLSAWLREAGRERLAATDARPRFETQDALDTFFRRCDEREQSGREPEWREHLKVIAASQAAGAADS